MDKNEYAIEPQGAEKPSPLDLTPKKPVDNDDDEFKFTISNILAYLSLCLGFAGDVFILTAVSASITIINQDIGPSSSYVWIINANYVGTTALSPFVGHLGDIFGRRRVLLAGSILGIIGSIVGARANDVTTTIIAGALQGLSASGHGVAWSSVGELVPKTWRPASISLLELTGSIFGMTGALIANAAGDYATWRWVYWTALIFNVAALILVTLFYHPIGQKIVEEGKSKFDQLLALDWIGAFLLTAGLVLFLMGINFGGQQYPWRSAGTLVPILIGLAMIVATGFWERNLDSDYAIYPRTLAQNFRGVTVPYIVMFLVGATFSATLVMWPILVRQLFTTDGITVGLYCMAMGAGGMFLGSPLGAYLLRRFDSARWQLVTAIFICTVVGALQALLSTDSRAMSTAFVTILGAVSGFSSIACNSMVQLSVPHELIGIGISLVVAIRSVGGVIANAIYISTLSDQLSRHLGPRIAAALAAAGVPASSIAPLTQALATGNLTSPALLTADPLALASGAEAIENTYVRALRVVYLVSLVFGVPGLMVAMASQNYGHLMNKRIDVKLRQGAHLIDRDDDDLAVHIIRR